MRRYALLACALLCAGCGGSRVVAQQDTRTTPLAPPAPAGGTRIPGDSQAADFALRDQNGRLIHLSAQRGRYVFLAFLYTHCTDVCPLISEWLDSAARPHARDVTVLAVSVDPQGDTPAAVRTFVREHRLGPEFHWLIGTQQQLAPVWQAYNVLVERRNADAVAHAAPVFLLDRKGRPRLFYAPPQTPGRFRHDLQKLLAR